MLAVMALHASVAAMDIDAGLDAVGFAKSPRVKPDNGNPWLKWLSPGWVRLRGIAMPVEESHRKSDRGLETVSGDPRDEVEETKRALQELRERGLKTCVLLRWPATDWRRKYLPEDLRAAYERGRMLGSTYGDLVDAWEIDNEPDLGFVPEGAERYATFLKAMYLGIKAGAAEAERRRTEDGERRTEDPPAPKGFGEASGGLKSEDRAKRKTEETELTADRLKLKAAPLVLMGALGLPPGPWLERFAVNDGFSYTDGYNYHYYGYAEDFTGVYRAHESALTELAAMTGESGANNSEPKARSYPIFLTEVGYGMLGKGARETKEGRLRQWRWFHDVGLQAHKLGIEAPMAFYLPPYLEYERMEYGLTVATAQRTEDRGRRTEDPPTPKGFGVASGGRNTGKRERRSESGEQKVVHTSWTAGGITYAPSDFGVGAAEPWMEMIGTKFGENEVTPALAWWLESRKLDRSAAITWQATAAPTTPVVVDFIPGGGMLALKRYLGHFVSGEDERQVTAVQKPDAVSPPSRPTPAERTEEFMVHVRTEDGALHEVYPLRPAGAAWQNYLEQGRNFTLSFYGRSGPRWRFEGKRPVSLVFVFYPKELPATFEFRHPELVLLRDPPSDGETRRTRHGAGSVVLYNFSDRPIEGVLNLPSVIRPHESESLTKISTSENDGPERKPVPARRYRIALGPHERREIRAMVSVPADSFVRHQAKITFEPVDSPAVVSRFVTEFFPSMEGMVSSTLTALTAVGDGKGPNRDLIAGMPRATEEAARQLQPSRWLTQQGARVEWIEGGFRVTVTGAPEGKEQRVEAEWPWPEGVDFPLDAFLRFDYRLVAP